jgi:hypothetical protein
VDDVKGFRDQSRRHKGGGTGTNLYSMENSNNVLSSAGETNEGKSTQKQ